MKAITLRPELQEIFDRLPKLIRVIESQVRNDIQTDLQRISDTISLKPDEGIQIIKERREAAVIRYNELINSGLRITATDENHTLSIIGLFMVTENTWKIPMPKNCLFQSIEPQPYGHIQAAIYPVYYQYNLIQACNELLIPTSKTPPNGIDEESKSKRLTMTELALLLYLNDEILYDPRGDADKNADRIAKENGFKKPTSGLQLYEHYKTILDTFSEWSRHDTDKIMKNRYNRIAKVLPMVKEGKHKTDAERILKELHNKLI